MPIGKPLRVKASDTAIPPIVNGAASSTMALSQSTTLVAHATDGSGVASSRAKQAAMHNAKAVDTFDRKALTFPGFT